MLTTSASKLSYVDLTADIFWPISIGQISAAPVALYSAMQNAAADDAAALAPWAERQTVCRLWSRRSGDADGPAAPGSAVSAERKGDFLL